MVIDEKETSCKAYDIFDERIFSFMFFVAAHGRLIIAGVAVDSRPATMKCYLQVRDSACSKCVRGTGRDAGVACYHPAYAYTRLYPRALQPSRWWRQICTVMNAFTDKRQRSACGPYKLHIARLHRRMCSLRQIYTKLAVGPAMFPSL